MILIGTKYEGVRFRRALLDTIPEIGKSRPVPHSSFGSNIDFLDALAHAVIPAHPPLKPHARMLHHFRFIVPLLNSNTDDDDEEFTPLHYYDSAIQLARNAAEEPTEEEFLLGMQAADEILKR